jgi:hypothetical protein
MTMAATMDALALAPKTAGIVDNAYGWPVESPMVPCVMVGYPTLSFDATYGRGADKYVYPVFYIGGAPADKATRDRISAVVLPLKAALDGVGVVRGTDASFDRVTINDIVYAAIRVDCEVYA